MDSLDLNNTWGLGTVQQLLVVTWQTQGINDFVAVDSWMNHASEREKKDHNKLQM